MTFFRGLLPLFVVAVLCAIVAVQCSEDNVTNPPKDTGPPSLLPGPNIAFADSSFDFGVVPQTSYISHTFWLYSVGDDTARIISVKPG